MAAIFSRVSRSSSSSTWADFVVQRVQCWPCGARAIASYLILCFVVTQVLLTIHMFVVPHLFLAESGQFVHVLVESATSSQQGDGLKTMPFIALGKSAPSRTGEPPHEHRLFDLCQHGARLAGPPIFIVFAPALVLAVGVAVKHQLFGSPIPLLLYAKKNSPPHLI